MWNVIVPTSKERFHVSENTKRYARADFFLLQIKDLYGMLERPCLQIRCFIAKKKYLQALFINE